MPDTPVQILHDRVIFKLEKSIPSAEAAASIKFGVEKVSGVSKVHFIGEDIEVVFNVEGAAIELILDALAEAGFPSAVAVGVAPPVDTSSPTGRPGENEQGTGLAIA